ncbi:MAG: nitroreductase [Verrucomicrobiota bacterium]
MKDHLQPWKVSGDFPSNQTPAEIWEFLLQYAILAPSTHNTQPWLFRIRGEDIELYTDRARALRVSDPDGRELVMSCGAALFNLQAALRHYNVMGDVDLFPDPSDPDLLARLWLGHQRGMSIENTIIFHAITKRHTNRQAFEDRPVPETLLGILQEAAEEEGAWLHVAKGPEEHVALADLISIAERKQWANKRFRLELAAWVHSNRANSRDGIPEYAQNVDDLLSYAGPLVVRTFDLGEGEAAKDAEIARYSPVLAVLGTDNDDPQSWLAAGQALEHVLLRARAENVWASFLNQPVEVTEMRPEVTAVLNRTGHAQLILRLGYGPEVKPTPRRDLLDVLI